MTYFLSQSANKYTVGVHYLRATGFTVFFWPYVTSKFNSKERLPDTQPKSGVFF